MRLDFVHSGSVGKGIDTSVLMRLTTGEQEEDFQRCVEGLRALVEDRSNEIFASNQVIGEAYIRRH